MSKEEIDKLNISIDLVWSELRKINRRLDDLQHTDSDSGK